ncbi:hypothetical protein ACPW96_18175 [Micromonospora sp. DT81.3]|uniref:hypothetical protein n=1 Tax=Micromonospora sp. DT81.3 TaxID=3416523 RepID=UPI003CE9EF27
MHELSTGDDLPLDAAASLFDAWVVRLASEELRFTQYGAAPLLGGQRYTYGDAGGAHFVVVRSGISVELESTSQVAGDIAERIILDAIAKVAARDLGSTVVYVTELTVRALDLADPPQFLRFFERQIHIEGARRLGRGVLLDFPKGLLRGALPGGFQPAPVSVVTMTIFADGPIESDFTARFAAAVTETAAAVCAVATGRAVEFHAPLFGEDEDEARTALRRRDDVSILNLARNGLTLDIFGYLLSVGGADALLRARGSVLAYHAALSQRTPDVAVMLLVSSIEALIAPRPPWGRDKVTKRFTSSLAELCPDAVDAVLVHEYTPGAFDFVPKGGVPRQRRELLEAVYDARSHPTHNGPGLSPLAMADWASAPTMRVVLLSNLARAALLAFIQAPRCSLIGHPEIDPPGSATPARL